MPKLTEFAKISGTLNFTPIGNVSAGKRLDVPFDGVATSDHWDGERPVSGVDRVTVGADGTQSLEIVARIGTGRDIVAYRAIGRGTAEGGPRELLTFETAVEDLAFLNTAVGCALGTIKRDQLELTVYLIED
ncbi:MAG: hypothetical protein ACN4GZ_05735 [Acidimicrobiales bacterium]